MKPFVRSANNYDARTASLNSAVFNDPVTDPSPTVQAEKDNCDINVIMKRYGVTGQMAPPARIPQYGDFEGITDFQSAQNAVASAKSAFMELPADVRTFFKNDPQQYLAFCSDPNNLDKMVELGLAEKRRPRNSSAPEDNSSSSLEYDDVGERTRRRPRASDLPGEDPRRFGGQSGRGGESQAREGDRRPDREA